MNYIKPEDIKDYVSKNPTGIAGNSKELSEMVNHFAELIVEECAGVCISRAAGYHVNHLIPDEAIFCSIYIRRHFGLE